MSIASISNIQFVDRLNGKHLVCRRFVKYDAEHTDGSVVRCKRLWKEIPKPTVRRDTLPGENYFTYDCSAGKVNEITNWIIDQERSKGRAVPTKPISGSLLHPPTLIQAPRALNANERLAKRVAAQALRTASVQRQNNRRIAVVQRQNLMAQGQLSAELNAERQKVADLQRRLDRMARPRPAPAPIIIYRRY